MALGAFVLSAIQRLSGAGGFQRKGFPIRMDLSPELCRSCVFAGRTLSLCVGRLGGEFLNWNKVELLVCEGLTGKGFLSLPTLLEHLESHTGSHCAPLSPLSKGRIHYIDAIF